MTIEEWKKTLGGQITEAENLFIAMGDHIKASETIEGVDKDELAAFMVFKLAKMNQTIERVFA